MNRQYRIGEFAQLVGISSETLRFYEQEGLLKPDRDEYNHRSYHYQDAELITELLQLKSLGLTIDELRTYVVLSRNDVTQCNDLIVFLKTVSVRAEHRLEALTDDLKVLEEHIQFYY